MTHIIPKQREDIPELEPILQMVEAIPAKRGMSLPPSG